MCPPPLPDSRLFSFESAHRKRCLLKTWIDIDEVNRAWIADMDCLIRLYIAYDMSHIVSHLESMKSFIPLLEKDSPSPKELVDKLHTIRREMKVGKPKKDKIRIFEEPMVAKCEIKSDEPPKRMEDTSDIIEVIVESQIQYKKDAKDKQAEMKTFFEICLVEKAPSKVIENFYKEQK
jgi:hypothetical protein